MVDRIKTRGSLGISIILFRRYAHIEQNKLTKLLGISKQELCSIESDLYFPNDEEIQKICDVIDTFISKSKTNEICSEGVYSDYEIDGMEYVKEEIIRISSMKKDKVKSLIKKNI